MASTPGRDQDVVMEAPCDRGEPIRNPWFDAGQGIEVSDAGQAALVDYLDTLSALDGEARPDGGVIRGWTFRSAAVTSHAVDLAEAIRVVTYWLRES